MIAEIADGIWQLQVDLPEDTFMDRTSAYLLTDDADDLHLVDTGWTDPISMTSLEAAIAETGRDLARLRTVTGTHLHGDHFGLAAELRERTGASVALSVADTTEMSAPGPDLDALGAAWGVPADHLDEVRAGSARRSTRPNIAVDRQLSDGDVLPIPGRTLRVIATPGHTSGSICLDDEPDGLLLTGDTVLPGVHPGIGLGADIRDPIGGYLAAIGGLAARFDDRLVCPGHGDAFRGLSARVDAHVAHHRRRTDEVVAVLGDDPEATVWQIASRIRWTAGWENLGRMRYSALRQTNMQREYVAGLG